MSPIPAAGAARSSVRVLVRSPCSNRADGLASRDWQNRKIAQKEKSRYLRLAPVKQPSCRIQQGQELRHHPRTFLDCSLVNFDQSVLCNKRILSNKRTVDNDAPICVIWPLLVHYATLMSRHSLAKSAFSMLRATQELDVHKNSILNRKPRTC